MPNIQLSAVFEKSYYRYLRKHPELRIQISEVIAQLELDPRAIKLKTHKLQGKWKGYYACSVAYDLRIVFEFVENQPEDDILLIDIGTHDDVY
jgi:addiction module RelE/StbE family toxin